MIDDKDLWSLASALMRKAPEDEAEWPVERLDALAREGRTAGVDVAQEIARRMHELAHQRLGRPS